MRMSIVTVAAGLLAATSAAAQNAPADAPADTSAITVSGSVTVASDYRFRGVSQTDEDIAVQGGITIAHESGFYIGTWGSNLSGWGTFGGANLELDLVAGYKAKLSDTATLDVGATVYLYPGGFDDTTVIEPYAKLSGSVAGASLTAGIAHAPKQKSLGRVFFTGAAAAAGLPSDSGAKDDNLYVWGDGAYAITDTPFTLKAHVGYSKGNEGLGPNGTSLSPTGEYLDWSVGVDTTYKNLTLGVGYVDTDISRAEAAYLQPSFSKGQDGTGSIADGTLLITLTAAF